MRPKARIGRTGAGAGLLALTLGLGLGACSTSGPTLLERIGGLAKSTLAGSEEEAGPQMTRAQLNQIPYAVIAISTEGRPRAFLVPLSDNDGYLNYRDAAGNAVVMFGGAVTGTESLGHDLEAVRLDPLDPVAHPTPLARWPERIQREYRYARRDLPSYGITLDCVFTRVARERIVIVEVSYDLVRVNETCTNAERQVSNTYWVQEATGFIWKSKQWIGPEIGYATIEIIRRYAG